MAKKLEYEYVKNYIEVESESECQLLSTKYKDNKQKLNIQCKCGNIFERGFTYFRNNKQSQQCGECSGHIKWDIKKMQKHCDDLNYKVLDTKWIQKSYQNQQWALVKCPNKNHKEYWVWWNSFKRGFYCMECYYEKNNFTFWITDKVVEFYKKYNLKIVNINEWKNVDKSVLCIDKYGYKVFASITNLKNGYGKPSLFQYNIHALENIKHYCKLYRPEYEILSDTYINIKTMYKWKYNGDLLPNNINKIFPQTADNFINGGCGHSYFGKSNGEIIFENELLNYNIKYKRGKMFNDCKDKKVLRFDFYIPQLNEIIEIDGFQHYNIIDFFGGEEGYKDRVKKDNIKNEYCKNNDIKITRIPYLTNKIEEYKQLIDYTIQIIIKNINNCERTIII